MEINIPFWRQLHAIPKTRRYPLTVLKNIIFPDGQPLEQDLLKFHDFQNKSRTSESPVHCLQYHCINQVCNGSKQMLKTFWKQTETIHVLGSAYLGSRIDGKLKFGLLAIIYRQPLHEQRGKTGSSAATKAVENKEALESSTLVRLWRTRQSSE